MPKGIYQRKPFTEEHIRNMSRVKRGKTPQNIKMIAGWNKGIKHTGEAKKRMSEKAKLRIGKKNSFYGKTHTKEIRIKLSEAHKGRHHTETTKRKIGEAEKGEKHWNWKGGISFEPYSVDWTETLRRAIRERDNYICQLCSQYGNVVHHIDYCKENCNPNNLITLCNSCNLKVNQSRSYWTNYFSYRT